MFEVYTLFYILLCFSALYEGMAWLAKHIHKQQQYHSFPFPFSPHPKKATDINIQMKDNSEVLMN